MSRTGVWYHTFGCKANQYDTERMRQEVESRGGRTVPRAVDAGTAVVNTCTVTANADREARRLVRRLARRHPGLRIVVAGCSSALRADAYRALSGVVAVVPGHDPVEVAAAVAPEPALARTDLEVVGGTLLRRSVRGSRAWMKIQDGCDRKCSFCATRLARGPSVSRAPGEILAEARLLARRHREIVLTGIHIGHYGRDREPSTSLAALCALLLERVPGVRFRLGSIEATEIDAGLEELLLSSEGMLAPHLHVPLQSGSDAVLRRMRRWHTREAYRSRVLELADRLDPIGLGADVIAGFPGETREDHGRTLALIEELPFSYLHVFPWSPRAGTAAAALPDRVTRETAVARAAELRTLGVEKGRRYVAARAGGEALVAVESATYGLTGDYLRVRLRGDRAVPGRLVRVRLSGVAGDLGADVGATGRAALPVLQAGLRSTQSPAVHVSLERSASGKT